ncbi:hypothetical protein DFH05DRAFT_1553084 [Lentinula detonsa]|uniref:Actin-like ATPase domain-containing protein n=1 Tax=Lentinula detonsa TaxID=2804962 RepID=A0A9W8NQB0_9AGAR|nr:hypothetical protein DFH05DRAFT_1553084 [Lentinula detonsa]
MFKRKPFSGTQQGLVLAIDIGTTYSGCSFRYLTVNSVLDPGVVPEIKGVTSFPAQPPSGASKIPSVLYYDSVGVLRAVGAETLLESIIERAEDEQWTKVEWFKLHLRPKSGKTAALRIHQQILALPLAPDKSIIQVYADFLRYLFSCCRTFIEERMLSGGVGFWESVQDRIIFVLSHPNGWEGPQQNSMRRAAVLAGLITENPEDRDRLHFVTEGEASLHFCINNRLTVKKDEGIIVVDAGGGTIDLSAYSVSDPDTNTFEEIAPSECCFSGSIFVTEEARSYFEDKLYGTRFEEDIPRITECFDQTTKLQFKDSDESYHVKFGGLRDREPDLDIRSGQMKIAGLTMARFFQPSIDTISEAIVDQRRDARKVITTVLLVGGFAASPWMFSKLKDTFQQLGLSIYRPDTNVNKAVSDGGVSFYLDHFVGFRMARCSYGIHSSHIYESWNPEHQRRGFFTSLDDRTLVKDSFSLILKKGIQITQAQEFRQSFQYTTSYRLRNISENILAYQGIDNNPSWIDVDPGAYLKIHANKPSLVSISTFQRCIPLLAQLLPMFQRLLRRFLHLKTRQASCITIHRLNFDIVLLFGLTELQAQIAWKENGLEKRSPAKIVYEQEL